MRKESIRHKQAFEYYYSLGPNRTVKPVADKFGVTCPSVCVWIKEFNWAQRIIDRDEQNLASLREETDKNIAKQMEAYKKIINDSVSEYIQKLKNNKIKIEKVDDFIKLVDLDLKLNGYLKNVKDKEKEDKAVKVSLDVSNQSEELLSRLFTEASRFGGLEGIKSKDRDGNEAEV